jgi:hypothetical protein
MAGVRLSKFVLAVWIDWQRDYDGGKYWYVYPAGMPFEHLGIPETDTKKQMETQLKRLGFEKVGPVRSHKGTAVDEWRRMR